MDQYAYEGLVRDFEAQAAHSPVRFRNKVVLVGSAAYVALFGALIGLVLLLYVAASWAYTSHRASEIVRVGFFALAILPILFVVLRMFFMRLEPPEGREIMREQATKLFELLDRMRKKLRGQIGRAHV